tara:strand:- start:47 stop:727 length:681 start_codon:yes stop_codon:yes gene_type:complete
MTLRTHTNNTFKNQLKFYEERAKKEYLIWCEQIINLIESIHFNVSKVSINDIGCNYFQLYKEIVKRNLQNSYDYYGYDIDKEFIDLGLKYFPELKDKHEVANIENITPRNSLVTVVSAVLEHTNNPLSMLDNILKSNPEYFFLRTFVGEKDINFLMDDKSYVQEPYFINQFSYDFMNDFFSKNKYEIEFIEDKATNNSLEYELFKDTGIMRKMYIIAAKNLNKNNI